MKQIPDAEATQDRYVSCPACQTLNGPFESFCRKCGSPVGTTATLNPVSTIQTEAFVFRKALDGPPRRVVLIGMWILFLPLIVVGVCVAIYVAFTLRNFPGFFGFWAFVGLTYIAVMILYRLTKKYIDARRGS